MGTFVCPDNTIKSQSPQSTILHSYQVLSQQKNNFTNRFMTAIDTEYDLDFMMIRSVNDPHNEPNAGSFARFRHQCSLDWHHSKLMVID